MNQVELTATLAMVEPDDLPWDPRTQRPDVAVLVALKEEMRELLELVASVRPWRGEGRSGEDYLCVVPNERGRPYRVVVYYMGDMGPSAGTHGADRLLALEPAVIVSLGIACSLDEKDLRLSDVIVANQIDGYDEKGKAKDDGTDDWTWQWGGEVYRGGDDVTRMADQFELSEREAFRAWAEDCERDRSALIEGPRDRDDVEALILEKQLRRRPHVLKAHLASGVSVAAAKAFRTKVVGRDRNIKALEMEAIGLSRAAYERRKAVDTLVLRGISDLGDADKKKLDGIGDGALRKAAMRNAVRLLWALMKTGRLQHVEQELRPLSSSKGSALPRLEHGFVGRSEEVARLRDALLAQPPVPAVVLGPAGFGKSTIAIRTIDDENVKATFGPRSYFVRLDAATSTMAAAELIAKQIGVKISKDPVAEIVGALSSERALLVLDNYETVWGAAGSGKLVQELARVEGLALVVTVRGLVVPPGVPGRCKIEVKQFSLEESVELFTGISGYADGPELRELLAKMEGVPLAIQLLAHAASPGGLSVLAADWEQRKTAVLARDGAADDREWNWRASLEVSWGSALMTEAARRAASVLAVLPDGLAERDRDAVLPVEGPAAAGLLVRLGLAYLEEQRLRMLATVREYLLVHHRPSADDHRRAAEHYRELATTLGPKPGWEGGAEATRRLAPEVANLDAMIRHGLNDHVPQAWIKAAAALRNFACRSGLSNPNPLGLAADRAGEVGDVLGQANCIWSMGDIALARSEHEEARGLYEQAQPLYERVGDILGQANCIKSLGDVALALSEHKEARDLYERALASYASIREPYSMGWTHVRLARVARFDAERAAHVAEARRLWVPLGMLHLLRHLDTEFGPPDRALMSQAIPNPSSQTPKTRT